MLRRVPWILALMATTMLVALGCEEGSTEDAARAGGAESDGATEAIEAAANESEAVEPVETSDRAVEPPIVVRVTQVDDGFGNKVDSVESIGSLKLSSATSLAVASRTLGAPDSSGPDEQDPNLCRATWKSLGIEAVFYFGHPPSPTASCEKGPLGAAYLTGDRIRIQPGGLSIGNDEAAVRKAFPEARADRLVGPFPAAATDADTSALLIAEGSYGGEPSPILYAAIEDAAVASFVFISVSD